MVGTAIAMSIHSAMNVRITKQIGGEVNGVNGWIYYWGEPERAPHLWRKQKIVYMFIGASVSEPHTSVFYCDFSYI